MYQELNELITNELNHYSNRPTTQAIITHHNLEIIHSYVEMYAHDELNASLAKSLSAELDEKLHKRIVNVVNLNLRICDEDFTRLLELRQIHEALTYEEAENLGHGKMASDLRKKWRKSLRKINKICDRKCKNHIKYIREWSKPRKEYVSKLTGEVHNGLYWHIKAHLEILPYLARSK